MVVLALATLTISAQERNVTVKVGVASSTIVGSDADGVKCATGWKLGASYDFAIAPNLYIVPGLEIVNKGFKDDIAWDGTADRYYFQIPVSVAYRFALSESLKLNVKAGPYVAYGFGGTEYEKTGWNSYGTVIFHEKKEVFDKGQFHRFDAGILAGASLDIKRFVVGVEYSRGFTRQHSGLKAFNQSVGAVVGYRF